MLHNLYFLLHLMAHLNYLIILIAEVLQEDSIHSHYIQDFICSAVTQLPLIGVTGVNAWLASFINAFLTVWIEWSNCSWVFVEFSLTTYFICVGDCREFNYDPVYNVTTFCYFDFFVSKFLIWSQYLSFNPLKPSVSNLMHPFLRLLLLVIQLFEKIIKCLQWTAASIQCIKCEKNNISKWSKRYFWDLSTGLICLKKDSSVSIICLHICL